MAETKLDLKGVIQVDDGDGWTSKPRDFKKIFEPFMNAIKAIRAEYPDHYIGLTYGANADQSSKLFTTQYGFTDTTTPSKADIDTTKLDNVKISEMLGIMKTGTGQAAVLSNPDVINMFTTNGINKFIIIPFDTMNSTVDKYGNGDIDGYGHKTDCIEFAKKFLALPKSIIIGWRNGKSLQSKITNNTERQNIVPGMDKLYFALGGGVAALTDPNLNHTTKDYIDFLISKWDSESQKFIESKIASVPDLKKKPDDKKVGTGTDGADAEKKPAGVTEEQKNMLRTRLSELTTPTGGEKKTAYGIAQNIFKAFFSGGEDKTNQTKEFLTNRVKELQGLTTIFGKDKQLAEIAKRLENPAAAAATSTVGRNPPIRPVVTPEKKYVFAFDIDNTLVRDGVLITTNTGRITPFNAATHAADHDAMLKLMNDMIVANHYVWFVTANSNISKDNFQKNYLTGEIGKKIIASENYYFMNPKTVADELKSQFVDSQISPLTDTTKPPLDLSFNKTDGGLDFQSKWLKPYAMIAKWLELKNLDMNDVQMYLFDDSDGYETTCNNVKNNKIKFVKIDPAPAPVAPAPSSPAPTPPPSPPPPSGFKSDVLAKATEKFEETKTTTKTTPKAPVTTDTDDPGLTTICSLEGFKETLTGDADNFPCTHNFCKKYSQKKSGGDKYNNKTNVVSACFAILIYDGRKSGGTPDSQHGKIVLASEHVGKRDFHLFGGSIDDASKCPLQTLYNEVAEEGRLLEIGKTLEDADAKKEFDAIFRDDKGNFLTEPCVHQKTLYFIGIIKRDTTSIWDFDGSKTDKARYIPGIKKKWTYTGDTNEPINLLTNIFKGINSGVTGYRPTYGEKNDFGFFSDDDIASTATTLFSQARKIFDEKVIQAKIRDVKKTIDLPPAGSGP